MDQIFTVEDVSAKLGLAKSTVSRWCRLGYVKTINLSVSTGAGNGYRIRESDLNEYLARSRTKIYTLPEPKKIETIKEVVVEKESKLDLNGLKTAANNLRIAINFAQEELNKIEALIIASIEDEA